MSDDPLAMRPEDHVNRALKAGVSVFLPAPIMEYFSYVVGDPAQERRDDFIRTIYARLNELAANYDQLQPDALRRNPAFQATFIEAAQMAFRTIEQAKMDMLRNAVLNAAIGTIDEQIRQIFLHYIDRLSGLHVTVLKLSAKPLENPEVRAAYESGATTIDVAGLVFPEHRNDRMMLKLVMTELESMYLVRSLGWNREVDPNYLKSTLLFPLGERFLRFISDPEGGSDTAHNPNP